MTDPEGALPRPGLSDEEIAVQAEQARLGAMAMRNAEGHYVDSTGAPVPGLPLPPEGHYWTVGDVENMAAGRAPRQIAPHERPVAVNAPHDVDMNRKPSNVTPDGVPHFSRRLDDGSRVCGGCTQEWPCSASRELDEGQVEANASLPQGGKLEAAARILGVSVEEMTRRMTADAK